MNQIRIAVLASGRGSNFRAIVEAQERGELPGAEVVALLTDRPDTGAEEFAKSRNIPVHVLPYKSFENRSQFDAKLLERLDSVSPDLVLALGFMRIIHESLVRKYQGRMINIHPSLLPAFPGMYAQRDAFEYGVKVTGVTVHFVDEGVDTGPIIQQAVVEVPEGCPDAGTLADLILRTEHRVLVRSVALFCRGALRIEGRRVRILE